MTTRRSRFLVVPLLVWSLGCVEEPPLEWPAVKQTIRERFPDVPTMSTSELASRLSMSPDEIVLLDARAAGEYAVSHLEHARLARDEPEALAALDGEPPAKTVVVYCSVGYRSADLASRLRARGVANVYNLEGSIFEWANEGRPVYRDGLVVAEVHPFDDRWRTLLDRRLWAAEF